MTTGSPNPFPTGRFLPAPELPVESQPWGQVTWLSRPDLTGAQHLTAMQVLLNPGAGHGFHFHPNQEEFILVLSGRIEQWLEREHRILGPGDLVFIPKALVHASYNLFDQPARVLPILSPCIGDGYEVVNLFDQAPWKDLKGAPHA
ncbi:MAG: cupin domain-containing protein [Planctomycetota bacterium]